ncbi:hypothetical protein VQ643_13055 [Pseudomonas sp. F1_0610]|uniref:hypothetical protein n=1 Tax=Pseudomonas sp. F1_0610 TaxID=3114284 RepID=UPI0039C05E3D
MLTTGTAALATITSLLAAFKADRSATQQGEFNDFITWLTEKNHNQVVEFLTQNQTTTISIKTILNQNHEQLVERLKSLEDAMFSIAINSPTFQTLAKAINPEAPELSIQAKNILKFIFKDGTGAFSIKKGIDEKLQFIGLNTRPSNEMLSEPRFLQEDLESLVNCGFFLFPTNNNPQYSITRQGIKFAQSLIEAESSEI